MRITCVLVFAALLPVSLAQAQCSAQSSASRVHLIELYTSEGCSSCPPADAWLRQLPRSVDVAALAFHVDYWDSLGWRDRFADADYTARQQMLAAHGGSGIVYTPEVAIDGREWRDWHGGGMPDVAANDPVRMNLSVETATLTKPATLRVRVNTIVDNAAEAASYRNYVALAENGLSSQVQAGENRGVLLRHDHVVRAFAGPFPLANADAQITVPADVDLNHAVLVAFSQREQDGAIAQVVSLPMAQCLK